MSSVQYLREFVNGRLTAAAEEIFEVFKQIIVEYEEEIDRQRRLLDIVWKPELKLHRIDLPQQHVYAEEVLTYQQFCIQEKISSLDQGDPEPRQIKEEQEELCISQEGEQLVLKKATQNFMLIPPDDDSNHSEPEQNYERQHLAHNSHVASQKGVKHEDSGSTQDAKSKPKNRCGKKRIHKKNVYSSTPEIHCNTHTSKKTFKCDFCGKFFKRNSTLHIHLRIHTGEKPYTCETCGNAFRTNDHLIVHMRRSHTGEKPYTCQTCGRSFTSSSELISHTRTHTGEKPHSCTTCRKGYRDISALKRHLRIHTGEKPYTCKTCGKSFRLSSALKIHARIHTGEKPHVCKICEDAFRQRSDLAVHMRRVHAELLQQNFPPDQQFCIQERNFTVDQNEPKPPQIKEEQEELCTSWE